jgi:hypothetical protein
MDGPVCVRTVRMGFVLEVGAERRVRQPKSIGSLLQLPSMTRRGRCGRWRPTALKAERGRRADFLALQTQGRAWRSVIRKFGARQTAQTGQICYLYATFLQQAGVRVSRKP